MTSNDIDRADYTAWLELWIIKENASIVKRAEKLKGTNPLRHKEVISEVERLWLDLLWCQDVTTSTCPEEYCLGKFDKEYDFDNDDQELVNECFDAAFRKVMPPNLHHVLEG